MILQIGYPPIDKLWLSYYLKEANYRKLYDALVGEEEKA